MPTFPSITLKGVLFRVITFLWWYHLVVQSCVASRSLLLDTRTLCDANKTCLPKRDKDSREVQLWAILGSVSHDVEYMEIDACVENFLADALGVMPSF